MRPTWVVLGLLVPAAGLAQDAGLPTFIRDDVVALGRDSNEARGEALQEILGRLGVAFTLETFEIPPRSTTPRPP